MTLEQRLELATHLYLFAEAMCWHGLDPQQDEPWAGWVRVFHYVARKQGQLFNQYLRERVHLGGPSYV